MKRVGYAEAKKLIAEGWKLMGKGGASYLGHYDTYARLVAPTVTDGYMSADEVRSMTWGCFLKLGGGK